MRYLPRIALWAVLIGVVPVVSGCSSFDPDSLDIFGLNEKKKMPGERRDLFPEGVPGVSQGIPQEYLRQPNASAAPVDGVQQQAAAPAAIPAEPTPPPAAKPAPRPRRTATRPAAPRPAAAAPVAPVEQQQVQPAQPAQQQAPAASSGWPAPSSSSSAWPAPQPSGTFQR